MKTFRFLVREEERKRGIDLLYVLVCICYVHVCSCVCELVYMCVCVLVCLCVCELACVCVCVLGLRKIDTTREITRK